MGSPHPQLPVSKLRAKDAEYPEAEGLHTLLQDVYDMCNTNVIWVATIGFLATIAWAIPITEDISITGCVNAWDSWGIACPNPRHHLFCDNLPGVRAGT